MVVGVLLDANETTVFGAYMYYLQFFPSPILIDIKFRSSYGYQNRMPDWIFLLNYQGFMHMHSIKFTRYLKCIWFHIF